MKKLITSALAMLMSFGICITPTSARATIYNGTASVKVELKASGPEVSPTGEIIFNSLKNDSDNRYQIKYTAEMDMTDVWNNFNILKGLITASPFQSDWNTITMGATFNITTKFDTAILDVDATMLNDVTQIKAQFDAENDPDFIKYFSVNASSYDPDTGLFTVTLKMMDGVNTTVLAKYFDDEQPAKIYVSTPSGSITMKQSKFGLKPSIVMLASDCAFDGVVNASGNAAEILITLDKTGMADSIVPMMGVLTVAPEQIIILRTGNTGEGISSTKDLQIYYNGVELTAEQLGDVTWEVENIAGFQGKSIVATATGNTVTAKKSGVANIYATYNGVRVTTPCVIVVPGDVDRSGVVNTTDASFIDKYVASRGTETLPFNDDYSILLADLDGSGLVNVSDATIIKKMLSRVINPAN